MNWRKPIVLTALKVSGSTIPEHLQNIRKIATMSPEEINSYQEKGLKSLLLHAYHNVPYYSRVLSESGVIRDGEVDFNNFENVPFLTKEIIRSELEELKSKDLENRKYYENHTGGSTGQPVSFIQDKDYESSNFANKIYFCEMAGKEIGEKEMKIWGSERDLLEGSTSFSSRMTFWLYNRYFENSFLLSEVKIKEIISNINAVKPDLIWGYIDSLFIIARYANENDLEIARPKAVISAAGTLTEDIRREVKKAFGCGVFNVYGSREMGDIAFEEVEGEGLSVFQHSHYVEVVKKEGSEIGDIVVTSLTNYSMPFIRYKIGDVSEGFTKGNGNTNFIRLKNVLGRETDIFKTKSGSFVPPEFFIHVVGVVYNKGSIKKFQVIQKNLESILIKIVFDNSGKEEKEEVFGKIAAAIRKVMGESCHIEFEPVDEIPASKSGKFRYTMSEING
jgi:phenylacetate-CoA ligase